MVKQEELEALVLAALYSHYQNNGAALSLQEITSITSADVTPARVELALGTLLSRRFVECSRVIISGQTVKYWLTDSGYKFAEEIFNSSKDEQSDLIEKGAPAADRIVGFDHNSSEFRSVLKELDALKAELKQANDVGEMSVRSVEVAREEVEEIERYLRLDFFRPSHLWQTAKSTLNWIGAQAAGAVVGQVALSLLMLLGALLGITLS